jgi:hypothetical protein
MMPLRKTRTSVLVLHTLQQGGIAHLAAGYISRTPYLLLLRSGQAKESFLVLIPLPDASRL